MGNRARIIVLLMASGCSPDYENVTQSLDRRPFPVWKYEETEEDAGAPCGCHYYRVCPDGEVAVAHAFASGGYRDSNTRERCQQIVDDLNARPREQRGLYPDCDYRMPPKLHCGYGLAPR